MRIAVWTGVLIGSVMSFGASTTLAQAAQSAPDVKAPAAKPTAAKPATPTAATAEAKPPVSAPNKPEAAKAAASGKAATGKPGAGAAAESLAIAQERLQSGDEATVRAALAALMQLGGEPAAQLVSARLRRGLPPLLIEAAVDALVLLDRPSAAPVLLELTQHRRVQVRVKAMQALAALRVRSAQSALLYALDDPNTDVRSAAVEALASVGNPRALPALYTAAERGVPGAWLAVGTIAGAGDVKTLFAHVHAGDVVPLRPALDNMLRRGNLPVEAKLHIAQLVQGLGSTSARECLGDWSEHLPADAAPRLRSGLAQLVKSFVEKGDAAQDTALAAGPTKQAPAAAREAAPAKAGASAAPPAKTSAAAAPPAKASAAAAAPPAKTNAAAAPPAKTSAAAAAPAKTGTVAAVPAAQGGAR